MANESLKPFPRGRLEQELDSIPSSTEGVPTLLETEQPYEDYEINLYGKRYRVPSPPKNIAKATPKPDYSKINVYEAVSVMEVSKALPALASVLMGMRSLKQGNQEFSMDANGYLHYLDTRLFESHSKLGNAANSEEAIALAEEWIESIRTAWPSAKSSFLNLKTFPEPFPSQYLGKPTAAAIASSDGKEILFWRVIYPIELKPSQWEDAAPLLGCNIQLCIKGQGNEAILGGMDYYWRGVNKVSSEVRFNIFIETEKGKLLAQQAQTPPANATASIIDLVIVPKPEIKQMVYEGDKGEKVNGVGWNGVDGNSPTPIIYSSASSNAIYFPEYISTPNKRNLRLPASKIGAKESFDGSIRDKFSNLGLINPSVYFGFTVPAFTSFIKDTAQNAIGLIDVDFELRTNQTTEIKIIISEVALKMTFDPFITFVNDINDLELTEFQFIFSDKSVNVSAIDPSFIEVNIADTISKKVSEKIKTLIKNTPLEKEYNPFTDNNLELTFNKLIDNLDFKDSNQQAINIVQFDNVFIGFETGIKNGYEISESGNTLKLEKAEQLGVIFRLNANLYQLKTAPQTLKLREVRLDTPIHGLKLKSSLLPDGEILNIRSARLIYGGGLELINATIENETIKSLGLLELLVELLLLGGRPRTRNYYHNADMTRRVNSVLSDSAIDSFFLRLIKVKLQEVLNEQIKTFKSPYFKKFNLSKVFGI
ncbi:MAG: hypothetical protein K1X82_09140 [Bacteroidia bacterium]|nr:hypothetical protein [Bacteroidia bacterium]